MPRKYNRTATIIIPRAETQEHGKERRGLLSVWASDPLMFLTGKDVDGSPVIVTKDESDPKTPYKPFPGEQAA